MWRKKNNPNEIFFNKKNKSNYQENTNGIRDEIENNHDREVNKQKPQRRQQIDKEEDDEGMRIIIEEKTEDNPSDKSNGKGISVEQQEIGKELEKYKTHLIIEFQRELFSRSELKKKWLDSNVRKDLWSKVNAVNSMLKSLKNNFEDFM